MEYKEFSIFENFVKILEYLLKVLSDKILEKYFFSNYSKKIKTKLVSISNLKILYLSDKSVINKILYFIHTF